jgi:hypothetical protein
VTTWSPATAQALQRRVSAAQARLVDAIRKQDDVDTAANAYMALLAEYRAALFAEVIAVGIPADQVA